MKIALGARGALIVVAALSLMTLPAIAVLASAPCTSPTAVCDMIVADDGETGEFFDPGCCQEPMDTSGVEAVVGTNDSSRQLASPPDSSMTIVASTPWCDPPTPSSAVISPAALSSPAPSPPLPDLSPLLL